LSDTSTDGGANTWNTTQQFTAVQFYSADTSGVGATIRASIGATMETANGSGSALTFFTNSSGTPAERMRLDASGNLGLGVTPSAWGSAYRAEDIGGVLGLTSSVNGDIWYNAYNNGTNDIYKNGGFKASLFRQNNGAFEWHNTNISAPSAGSTITLIQAMTLDASGNFLVGLTSSTAKFHVTNGASPASRLIVGAGGGAANTLYSTLAAGDYVSFETNAAERARITSGGDLLIGTNAAACTSKLDVLQTTAATSGIGCKSTNSNAQCFVAWNSDTSGDNIFAQFYTETSATSRGSITYNRAGGLVAYNTTSDYRAKDILGPVQNPGTTIDALKVYNGKMKGATVERPMLVAHEAQEVTPYAVTGEKDAVNDDGTPKYQQMDVSSLVPLLIAEIQSLRARVAQLEAK
jgi:hypothetical protein